MKIDKKYNKFYNCVTCDDNKEMSLVCYTRNKYDTLILYYQCNTCEIIRDHRRLSKLEKLVKGD